MTQVTEEQIREKLKGVAVPQRRGDVIACGAVSGISVSGGKVFISVETGDFPEKAAARLCEEIGQAVTSLAGVESVRVLPTAERMSPPQLSAPRGRTVGMQATHKISTRPVAPHVRHIIAVASGKGGVGKSTVSANLALAFAALGKKTGLLDADIYGASQPRMMGLKKRPEANAEGLMIPPVAHGVKVVSMGLFVDPQAPVIWRGPMVHSAIQQLFRDVDWGDLDVLVVDLPPGTGDAQLSLAQNVPLSGAVIVSTPQDVALTQAKKAVTMFDKTGVPVLGMIENMSYYVCPSCGHRDEIFGHGGARHAALTGGLAFLGELPLMPDVRDNADAGVPIVKAAPFHPVAEAFRNIAGQIWVRLPEKRAENRRGGTGG